MAVILAFGSAAVFALGTVLQQRVVMDAPIGQWVVAGAVVIGVAAGLLVAGMTITQLSLQTGILPPAVATSSIFNPAASVVLGLTLFDEQVHHSTGGRIGAAIALLAMFGGIAALAFGRASRLRAMEGSDGKVRVIYRSPEPDIEIPDLDVPEYVLGGAAARGDHPAVIDGATGAVTTYAEFAARVDAVAAALQARGIGKGDVVALVGPNSAEWAIAYHGILRAGGVVTPMNPLLTPEEMGRQEENSGPSC